MDIDEAIKADLAVPRRCFAYGETALKHQDYVKPHMRSFDGLIMLQSLDVSHRAYKVTPEEYMTIRTTPFRQVGMWQFVPESDPATGEIEFANRSPDSAGRSLYEARAELKRAKADAAEYRRLLWIVINSTAVHGRVILSDTDIATYPGPDDSLTINTGPRGGMIISTVVERAKTG